MTEDQAPYAPLQEGNPLAIVFTPDSILDMTEVWVKTEDPISVLQHCATRLRGGRELVTRENIMMCLFTALVDLITGKDIMTVLLNFIQCLSAGSPPPAEDYNPGDRPRCR